MSFYKGNKTFSVEKVELKKPGQMKLQLKLVYVGICGTDACICGSYDKRVGSERIIATKCQDMSSNWI